MHTMCVCGYYTVCKQEIKHSWSIAVLNMLVINDQILKFKNFSYALIISKIPQKQTIKGNVPIFLFITNLPKKQLINLIMIGLCIV
jgi:hypothetical protein